MLTLVLFFPYILLPVVVYILFRLQKIKYLAASNFISFLILLGYSLYVGDIFSWVKNVPVQYENGGCLFSNPPAMISLIGFFICVPLSLLSMIFLYLGGEAFSYFKKYRFKT